MKKSKYSAWLVTFSSIIIGLSVIGGVCIGIAFKEDFAFLFAFSKKVLPSSIVSWSMPASFKERIVSKYLPSICFISIILCFFMIKITI